MLASTNTILHERQLEEYYCTLCYAMFDFKRRDDDAGQLGAAVPDPLQRRHASSRSSCRACRSGSFAGSTYDELSVRPRAATTSIVFCSDGVFEANDALGREFGAERPARGRRTSVRTQPAREIVDAIFAAVHEFRGDTPPNDDMTAVALKITA